MAIRNDGFIGRLGGLENMRYSVPWVSTIRLLHGVAGGVTSESEGTQKTTDTWLKVG